MKIYFRKDYGQCCATTHIDLGSGGVYLKLFQNLSAEDMDVIRSYIHGEQLNQLW